MVDSRPRDDGPAERRDRLASREASTLLQRRGDELDVYAARSLRTREGRKQAQKHTQEMARIRGEAEEAAARNELVAGAIAHAHYMGAKSIGIVDANHCDFEADLQLTASSAALTTLTKRSLDRTIDAVDRSATYTVDRTFR